jgi:hypothetical protein
LSKAGVVGGLLRSRKRTTIETGRAFSESIEKWESSLCGNRLDQIPSIAIEVLKDSHDAICLVAGVLDKTYTPLRVGEVVSREVIRL